MRLIYQLVAAMALAAAASVALKSIAPDVGLWAHYLAGTARGFAVVVVDWPRRG